MGYKINGKTIDYFPTNNLHEAVPVYEKLDGWKEIISKCKKYGDLPKSTRQYIEFLEKKSGVPIGIISIGPDRLNAFRKELLFNYPWRNNPLPSAGSIFI